MPQTPGSGTRFPTSLDSFTQPTPVNYMDLVSHAGEHDDINSAVMAIEAKLGIGNTTPVLSSVLIGTGVGSSAWSTSPEFASLIVDNGISVLAGGIAVVGNSSVNGTLGVTGAVTLNNYAAHSLLVGEAGSAVVGIAPGTAGIPLIGAGAAADPAYGTAVVAGGGTGRTTLTAHAIVVGNGTTAVALVGPGATSGIPLIAQGAGSDPAFGTAVVAGGGTGVTSFTAYAVVCGGTTSTGGLQNVSGVGTSGQVLTSGGAGALPTWTTLSGGTLPDPVTVPHGGTGDTTLTAYAVLCGGTTTTGAVQALAALGASGTVLTSNGAAALPSFQAVAITLTTVASATNPTINANFVTITGTTTMTDITTTQPQGSLMVLTFQSAACNITTGNHWKLTTGSAKSVANGLLMGVIDGSANFQEVYRSPGMTAGGVDGPRSLVSHPFNQATQNVNSTGATGTYVDLAAGYSISVVCLAGDRVVLHANGDLGVTLDGAATTFYAAWAVDKDAGTKLLTTSTAPIVGTSPLRGTSGDVPLVDASLIYVDDNVTAATHTYKLQGLVANNSGSAQNYFGNGRQVTFRVEVWR